MSTPGDEMNRPAPADPPADSPDRPLRCPACGTPNRADARWCSSCAQPLGDAAEKAQQPTSAPPASTLPGAPATQASAPPAPTTPSAPSPAPSERVSPPPPAPTTPVDRPAGPVRRPEPPRTEPPRAEPPRTEPPRAEPPRSEPPRSEPARTEPRPEPWRAEPPRTEPPRAAPSPTEPARPTTAPTAPRPQPPVRPGPVSARPALGPNALPLLAGLTLLFFITTLIFGFMAFWPNAAPIKTRATKVAVEETAERDIEEVAERFADNLINFKAETIGSDLERLSEDTTDAFAKQYHEVFDDDLDGFRKSIIQEEASSKGDVRLANVTSRDEDTATVVVVVSQTVDEKDTDPFTGLRLLELTMVDTGSGWKVDNVGSAPTAPGP